MNYLDKIIECAQKLGGLSAAAIFALISMYLGYIVYRRDRYSEESNEKWRLTRESQVRAEEAQTSVAEKIVEVTSMNTAAVNAQSSRIDRLATLIDERIPRRT